MLNTPSLVIAGRIFLDFDIETLTGLHIGGAPGTLAIGNVDNPVVRNPFNNEPYIPGSSLRGKMRSQTEKLKGVLSTVTRIGQNVKIHVCETRESYEKCDVCRVYGVSAATKDNAPPVATTPTRLIIRDANLTPDTRSLLSRLRTDLPFTEVKWEAAIDRVTSAATPRQQERVPAGAVFGGALTFTLYNDVKRDVALFETVIRGLELVEEDYLGGQGARGSGQVKFSNITLRVQQDGKDVGKHEKISSLFELRQKWEALSKELTGNQTQ